MAESKTEHYGKHVDTIKEHEDRHGQTLITREHEVIKRWAEARKAKPATVPGSEHQGHPGVLRFDFPDYGGKELEHISWDDWFRAFDERKLNFIYQEHKADGHRSNFFRLENPNREGG